MSNTENTQESHIPQEYKPVSKQELKKYAEELLAKGYSGSFLERCVK